jgi:hypothetical protein
MKLLTVHIAGEGQSLLSAFFHRPPCFCRSLILVQINGDHVCPFPSAGAGPRPPEAAITFGAERHLMEQLAAASVSIFFRLRPGAQAGFNKELVDLFLRRILRSSVSFGAITFLSSFCLTKVEKS